MIILLLQVLLVSAQNVVYDENAEVRTVGSFTSIEVSGTISLYLSQGTSAGVAISAGDAKYNSKIKTEVVNGVLKLSVDGGLWNGFNWTNRKLKAYVTVTDLNRLEVSGASYVTITGSVKSKTLGLDISGASEVKGAINTDKLNMTISGASVARLSGVVSEGLIDASGACKVSSYNLVFDTCKISSSGVSDIRITVNNQLNADASGGSTIYYKGAAVSKMLNSSGGASIKYRGNED